MTKYFTKRERTALALLLILFITDLAVTQLYIRYPHIDVIFHFLGGFFVALFFIGFFKKALIAERSLIKDVVIIVGASILFGIIWEFFEFIIGLELPPTTDYLKNTLKDLAMDMVGAATMFFIIRQRHKRSKMFQ